MTSRITEFFGSLPLTPASIENANNHHCPFVAEPCIKNRVRSLGACSLQVGTADPVIICPNRLYAGHFAVLSDVASRAFGGECELVSPTTHERRRREGALTQREVVVFGKYFGGELGIPTPPGLEEGEASGSFYIDFLLAKLSAAGTPEAFAAVEVQTIDTTDSYAQAAAAYKNGQPYDGGFGPDQTKAGLNWENVTKRILPQLIYKGHALRREPLCVKGLFFVLPHAVFQRIKRRVGGRLLEYPMSAGTITFCTYDLGAAVDARDRPIVFRETMTTTVEQIAFAFVSPQNLPDAGVYENVIRDSLARLSRRRSL